MRARPVSVLHVTEGYEGGVVTYMRHVLPRQRAAGFDVSLVCSPRDLVIQGDSIRHLVRRGIRVHVIPMCRAIGPITDLLALKKLVRIMRREKFDLVHTHCFKGGVLGRLAAVVAGCGCVIHTPHCLPSTRCTSRIVRPALLAIERFLARWTDHYVFVSQSQSDIAHHEKIVVGGRSSVVGNGVSSTVPFHPRDFRGLRRELNLVNEDHVVGMCARLCGYKGIDQLILAAPDIQRAVGRTRFIIAGEGPDRPRLERMIRHLNLRDIVHLIGHRADVSSLIRLMDVCVVSSRAEGMPYVILESFNAGTPVVASDVPGNADLVRHGHTGLLYPYNRIDQLAHAVVHCLRDCALCRQMTETARLQIEHHHSLDRQIGNLLAVYEKVIQKGTQAAERNKRPNSSHVAMLHEGRSS